jgi:hypothetical protein
MADNTNPLPGLLQMVLAGQARHILTGLSGAVAASAGLSHDQQTQFVTGGVAVILYLAGAGWSFMQKSASKAAVQTALTGNVDSLGNPLP